jgi:hypothetical protein
MLIYFILTIDSDRKQAGKGALMEEDFVGGGIAGMKGARQAWKQRP